MAPVIVLEFNELTPSLMKRFIDEGVLPNFRRLRDSAQVFTTEISDPISYLEPWVQWVTVHTGVGARRHQVQQLGHADHYQGPRVWDALSEAGHSVLLSGSMNIGFRPGLRGVVIPDPWSSADDSFWPLELGTYVRYVQHAVREHTNRHGGPSLRETFGFLAFLLRHGLSLSTVTEIMGQALREIAGRESWKRACLLDSLQWDVFQHYYRQTRPSFATFFLNSTAHFQHLYWRDLEPERFLLKPDPIGHEERREAIRFGYRHMDRLLGKCMKLAGDEATIILCTALSQQPHLNHETSGGKVFYRPRDIEKFLTTVGLTAGSFTVAPVMAEEFYVHFGDEAEANAAAETLEALRVNGDPLLKVRREGRSLFCGCAIFGELNPYAVLNSTRTLISVGFFEFFYRADALKSGRHHPDGMLWIRRAGVRPRIHPNKVPLTVIAPTILSLFELEKAPEMEGSPLWPPGRPGELPQVA